MAKAQKEIEWKFAKWSIEKLKLYKDNPRKINKKGLQDLRDSLGRFGNASAIVLNTDGTVIGGEQRIKLLKQSGLQFVNVLIPERKLTPKEVRELNIRLNKNIAGEFNFEILVSQNTLEELGEYGFARGEIKTVMNLEEGEEIEVPKSVQIAPPMEYIVLICPPNSVEWEELKTKLQLRRVRRGGYKKGSAFDDTDLERVLHYKDFKKRYKK